MKAIATRNLWKLYAMQGFSALIPAYVIERLFWEQRGMTIQDVVLTEMIYAVTIVLLEVPTGILADRWSRKRLLVVSALLGCSEFLILIFATQFWHFAAVVFLAGIARSAGSGAENALLYDSLLLEGRAQSFERLLGRLNAVSLLAAMAAALCGSLLAVRFGLVLNYWLSLGSALAALGVSLTLTEPAAGTRGEAEAPVPLRAYLTASLRFFRTHPDVSVVVLCGMVTGAALSFIYEFWQLYLDRLAVPTVYFGLFSAAFTLLGIPGSLLAHTLRGRFSYRALLLTATGVMTAGFLCVSLARDTIGLAAMLLIGLVAGIVEPLAAGYLHHRIASSMRATIDSFQSLGQNAVLILTGLGFGLLSARLDVFGGYGFIAAVCAAYFLVLAFSARTVGGQR